MPLRTRPSSGRAQSEMSISCIGALVTVSELFMLSFLFAHIHVVGTFPSVPVLFVDDPEQGLSPGPSFEVVAERVNGGIERAG